MTESQTRDAIRSRAYRRRPGYVNPPEKRDQCPTCDGTKVVYAAHCVRCSNRLRHPSLEERFWSKVDRRGPDECWPWSAYINPHGYGSISVDPKNKSVPAHRVAYELAVGPIPSGLEIDHLCRNRACVNPTHLEAVTGRENSRRGFGFAAVNARKTHCKNGHEFTTDNVYSQGRRGGRKCKACHTAIVARRVARLARP